MQVSGKPADKRTSQPAPQMLELLGGQGLSPAELRKRPDAESLEPFIELLANAEYWLSFELVTFEPALALCPSPLRELAVGIALRFGHAIDGALEGRDLESFAANMLDTLPADLRAAVDTGLTTLRRVVGARVERAAHLAAGFKPYEPDAVLSVHALRASGSGTILIDGLPPRSGGAIEVAVGAPIALRATDERGRPLEAPAIERRDPAPILAKDDDGTRTAIFLVPGKYRVRVPGKAQGALTIVAR